MFTNTVIIYTRFLFQNAFFYIKELRSVTYTIRANLINFISAYLRPKIYIGFRKKNKYKIYNC